MTESKSRWVTHALGIALVAASVACGNASGSLSPTGPSATGSGGAVISGRVRGMTTPVTADSFAPLATSALHVTISGTNISSTVDGSGQFTLTGVPPGTVTLQFSGPGVSASITLSGVTAGEQITIDVTLNGNSARLEAESRRKSGREIEGHITAVDATARTITVGGSVIAVPSTARIHRGSTTMSFADLKVGMDVEVETMMNGTTLVASDVKIDDDNEDDDDRDGLTEVSGAVSGLTGTCPAITFIVRDRTVITSGTTRFELGCSRIQNNVRVEAKGALAPNGSLMATSIELDD